MLWKHEVEDGGSVCVHTLDEWDMEEHNFHMVALFYMLHDFIEA